MNKQLPLTRMACVLSLCCQMGLPVISPRVQAQTKTAPTEATIRQANFIVAVVNSEPITNVEVQTLRRRLLNEAMNRTGTEPETSELNALALEQLIHEKVQLQQARDLGIIIDDEALDQAELNVAASNQLTREAMLQRLVQDGIGASEFREQLRRQLTLTRLREREVEGRVRVSDQEVEQYLLEKIKAQAAQVPGQLNLGMILIAVPENHSETETQSLSEQAAQLVRRARAGESFRELANAFSKTPEGNTTADGMGLRPVDRYPELFAQATKQLKVGEVAEPVRSAAGFHILKVLERRQATTLLATQTRARHILLRPSAQMSQAQAVAKLNEVRQTLLLGQADFAAQARSLSQDASAQQGGDLGWTSPGMFVPEFEQVMNSLRPGQIAQPLVSRFGVHLIEVTDRRDAPLSEREQRAMAHNALREMKLDETHAAWLEDIRGRAYVEMREPPQ